VNYGTGHCVWPRRSGNDTAPARIAIASHNRAEIVELMFAIWAAECVVVPISYKLHPREMAQILPAQPADNSAATMS
jgi:acyl-CoA synthetase (AMP-forming)/AMP-acid ligase II